MSRRSGVRVQDSLYGIIDLQDHERRVIDSPSFQRLLSVKQLGFAYAAFPGGDYSRFSHSVGACHVMEQLVQALRSYGNVPISDTDRNIYRLAAILHDVGHYPFSHALEYAIKRRYTADVTRGTQDKPFLFHEQVSAELLKGGNNKLKDAVESCGISADAVARVFTKKDPLKLVNLISSDVDADRLDYLKRTAYHTGLPFGDVDQNYVVREVRLDKNDRLCWSSRALGALDHVLIGRFYDYQQIVHNKTVVAMEEVLKDVVYALTDPSLGADAWDLSADGVRQMIADRIWYRFDDHMVFERIKTSMNLETPDPGFNKKCEALIERNPPRRLVERCALMPADFEAHFDAFVRDVRAAVKDLAKKHNLDESLWWVWDKKRTITGYEGKDLPTEDDESTSDLVHVIDHPSEESRLAVLDPQSLVGKLCTTWKYALRVYVLLDRTDARRERLARDAHGVVEALWSDRCEKADGMQLNLSSA